MKPLIKRYLERLDSIVGNEGQYHLITEKDEAPSVWVITYHDTPDRDDLTAFTFGLSSVNHPDWKLGRPELVVSVNSTDINWGLAVGLLVKRFRGSCPFSYGNVIRFGERICDESAITAFLIFAPTVLEKDQSHLKLADRTINIVQAYPIYEEEIKAIEEMGAQRFFMQQSVEFCDVKRKNTGRRKKGRS